MNSGPQGVSSAETGCRSRLVDNASNRLTSPADTAAAAAAATVDQSLKFGSSASNRLPMHQHLTTRCQGKEKYRLGVIVCLTLTLDYVAESGVFCGKTFIILIKGQKLRRIKKVNCR